MPIHPNVPACSHIKVTGVRCGSPALRGEQFCYFHQRMLRGVQIPTNSRLHPIALIENEESIQASLMEIINAIARNTIDLRRADLILKALHIAVKNSRRVRFESAGTMVQQVPNYAPQEIASTEEVAYREEETGAPSLTRTLRPEPALSLSKGWETTEADTVMMKTTPDPTQRKPPSRANETKPNQKTRAAKAGR